ncbi:MAG: phenylalanine--tRNA ligase beta subunit-related protein [Planctomycetota bacterium]|jgi:DNA/RNA-binding domain of Phe-tRNA-synthetase-like protein
MLDVSLQLPIRLAVVEVHDVEPFRDAGAFEALEACAERYRAEAAARGVTAPGGVPGVEVARRLFHALGVDPTRHRPCSEALLNRALKGRPQPRIGSLVDVGNLCSLDLLLPLGIYDRRKITGRVVLRPGRAGETYPAINGRDITLADRYLLADEEGPFGSPITDSRRTAVGAETTETVVIVYAPADHPAARFAEQARLVGDRVVEHCGGRVVQCELAGGDA